MKLKDYSVSDLTELIGSKAPAPGGGAAAALVGAAGISLSEMVCSLTEQSRAFEESKERMTALREECAGLRAAFLAAMDADAQAFASMEAVFAMPKGTDEEKAVRTAAMQDALRICAVPPMDLMQLSLKALRMTDQLVGKTTRAAVSDLGVAAVSLFAAVKGAWLNVLININHMKDTAFAQEYRLQGETLLRDADRLSRRIYKRVVSEL